MKKDHWSVEKDAINVLRQSTDNAAITNALIRWFYPHLNMVDKIGIVRN